MPITIDQIGTGPDNNFISGAILDSTTAGIWVLSGGTAIDTTVKAGGYLDINSGGTATNIKWTPCVGQVFAGDGAYVTYASSYSGVYYGYNNQLVSSAVTLVNKSVSGTSGAIGAMYVMAGGVADNTSVSEDGFMYIHSGGTANRTTVSGDNAHIRVRCGGTATSTHIVSSGSMLVFSKGFAKDSVVDSWGRMTVASGGTASNTIVSSGSVGVYGGGILTDTIIGLWGTVNLSSGGIATKTTLQGGKLILENGARVTDSLTFDLTSVASNNIAMINNLSLIAAGVSLSITVSPNQALGEYKIAAEGASSFTQNITVKNAGDTALGTISVGNNLSYGEYTYALTNNNSSLFFIVSNLDTDAPILNGEPVAIVNNQSVTITWSAASDNVGVAGYQIKIGNNTYSTSGTSYSLASLTEGGTYNYQIRAYDAVNNYSEWSQSKSFIISFAPEVSSAVRLYREGHLYSSGRVINNLSLSSDYSMFISSGGTANYTTVNSGGSMSVSSGGIANSTKINSSGFMSVSSGGTANNTTINYYGNLGVASGGTTNSTTISCGSMYVNGGTADNTTISGSFNSSGILYVASRGMVNNTTVVSSGILYVSCDGLANSTTVNSHGRLTVNGGTANYTAVNQWGSMYVSRGGTANNTTVDRGYLYVSNGCTANSTTVNSGYQWVLSGGIANSTTVNSYGHMYVPSGGMANEISVNSGGALYVSSGGTANNVSVSAGGGLWGFSWQKNLHWDTLANGSAIIEDNICFVNFALHVSSGGTANNTRVYGEFDGGNSKYRGSMFVFDGGTVNSTMVNSGGELNVYSGGIAHSTTVYGVISYDFLDPHCTKQTINVIATNTPKRIRHL